MQRELLCQDVMDIIRAYMNGSSQAELSTKFQVSEKAIYNLIYLRTYMECSRDLIAESFGGVASYLILLQERKTFGLRRK